MRRCVRSIPVENRLEEDRFSSRRIIIMWRSKLRWLIATGAFVSLMPSAGLAQESTVSGTVTDSTGGVLPGVTVTALNEASGNTFVAVTDERGTYRLSVRTGTYRIALQLTG